MLILSVAMSHFVNFVLFLFTAYLSGLSAQFEEPTFPDIFKLLVGRNGLRLQYEINAQIDNKGELADCGLQVNSILI